MGLARFRRPLRAACSFASLSPQTFRRATSREPRCRGVFRRPHHAISYACKAGLSHSPPDSVLYLLMMMPPAGLLSWVWRFEDVFGGFLFSFGCASAKSLACLAFLGFKSRVSRSVCRLCVFSRKPCLCAIHCLAEASRVYFARAGRFLRRTLSAVPALPN